MRAQDLRVGSRAGRLSWLAGTLLVVGLSVAAGPAWGAAQGTQPPPAPAPGEPAPGGAPAPPAEEEPSHLVECAHKAKTEADVQACHEAPNPILPETSEIVWGAITFAVLFFLLNKFAFPALKKSMDARADKIRNSLDEAEGARTQAQEILEQYQRQLADAKGEASRIIEEARQAADKLRQDLKRQAEAEMAEVKQRAQDDIAAQASRTMANLRGEVSQLALDLAERVVERSLDRQTNIALIEQFIDQAGSAANVAPGTGGNGSNGNGASGSPSTS